MRESLVAEGLEYVAERRYFTIWAPRQTGKSTYFRLLADHLKELGYGVAQVNVENGQDATKTSFLKELGRELQKGCRIKTDAIDFAEFGRLLQEQTDGKNVLIIDEIEGLNPELFNPFLHILSKNYIIPGMNIVFIV